MSKSLLFNNWEVQEQRSISSDMNDFDQYRTMYHTVVNNSKKVHNMFKELEIKVIGSGQLLGIEDAVLLSTNRK